MSKVEFDGDDVAVLPDDRARRSRSSARRRPTSAATSPTSTRAPISARLDQALAARNNGGIVIAQVKRVAKAGSLKPHDVRVPGILVDYVVVAPDQMQTTQTRLRPGHLRRESSGRSPASASPEFGVQKVIARRVAQELRAGDAVNIGFGISANVPRILIEEGQHGAVTWVIEQGAVGGVPLLDFEFGCASNAEAIVPSPYQFTYFQGGGFDASLLSFLQIDRERLGQRLASSASGRMSRPGPAASSTSRRARARSSSPASSWPARSFAVEDGRLVDREGRQGQEARRGRSSTSPSPAGAPSSRGRTSPT